MSKRYLKVMTHVKQYVCGVLHNIPDYYMKVEFYRIFLNSRHVNLSFSHVQDVIFAQQLYTSVVSAGGHIYVLGLSNEMYWFYDGRSIEKIHVIVRKSNHKQL